PVDEDGRFTAEVTLGKLDRARVFDANPEIVEGLAARGLLLNKPGETIRHQYPCCWRCRTRSSSAPRCSGLPGSARPRTRRRCATGRWPRSGAPTGSPPGARTASAA